MRKYLLLIFALAGFLIQGFASTYEVTTYTSANTSGGLKTGPIGKIASDAQGNIWVSYFNPMGVTKFNGTTWVTYTAADGLAANDVRDIAVDANGKAWFATNFGVSSFDGTTWTSYNSTNSGLLDDMTGSIAVDAANNVWVGSSTGLSFFDGTTWTTYVDFGFPTGNNMIDKIVFDAYGNTWICSLQGVSFFNGQTWTPYTPISEPNLVPEVVDIAVDPYENVWFMGVNWSTPGISKYNPADSTWTMYSYANTTFLTELTAMVSDNQGFIWTSQFMNGLWRFDTGFWELYDTLSGLPDQQINSLAIDHTGVLWLGSATGLSFMKPLLEVYAYSEMFATCGQCDGSMYIDVYNGSGDYTFSWNNGSQTNSGTFNGYITDSMLCPGVYSLTVTDNAGGLDPWTGEVTITNPPGYISGAATYNAAPVSYFMGWAELYKVNPGGVAHSLYGTYQLYMYDGSYYIYDLPAGDYVLKIVKSDQDYNYPDVIDTYYGNVFQCSQATVINLQCGGELNFVDVEMMAMAPMTPGNGSISGTIRYIPYGAKALGDPVPGAEVYIEQEPNDEPVANTTTDVDGRFSFGGLGDSLYSIYVDIPGLEMISTYENIDISTSDTTFENMNFFVDTVLGLGISTDSAMAITEVHIDNFSVNIFPNPTHDQVTIDYSVEKKGRISILVYDNSGRIVDNLADKVHDEGSFRLTYTYPGKGIYNVVFRNNNNYYLKRLIKQ